MFKCGSTEALYTQLSAALQRLYICNYVRLYRGFIYAAKCGSTEALYTQLSAALQRLYIRS